jgi:hypothetical protein
MNGLSEGKRSEDKQGRFLNLLKKWPVVLNNKSQISAVKGKKEGFSGTLQILCTNFWRRNYKRQNFKKDKQYLLKPRECSDEFHHLRQLQPGNKESIY